ncbi:MAG: DUF6603 domain-containing protein [Candidatus Heimdallarchaeota archaeon]
MTEKKNFIKIIGEELSDFVQFFENKLSSPQKILYYIRGLGWNIPTSTDFSNCSLGILSISSEIVETLTTEEIDFIKLVELIQKFIASIDDLTDDFDLDLETDFMEDYIEKFPKQLLDFILASYIEQKNEKLYFFLMLLGIIEENYYSENLPIKISYIGKEICWERLQTLFSAPQDIPAAVYGWGSTNFNHSKLLGTLQNILLSFNNPVEYAVLDVDQIDNLDITENSLIVPIIDNGLIEIGLEIYPLNPTSDNGVDGGLAFAPYLTGDAGFQFDINEIIELIIETSITLDKTVGIKFRPQTKPSFFALTDDSEIDGSLKFTLNFNPEDNLVGNNISGTHIQIKGMNTSFIAEKTNSGDFDFGMEIGIHKLKFIIAAGEGDGFIQKVLPKEPLIIDFDLTFGIMKSKGFYFKTAAGLEYIFQINKSIGPIFINTLGMKILLSEEGIELVLATSGGVDIGPITATINEVGFKTLIEFGKPGMLGNSDLSFGFKPPSAIGIAIDAESIKGGGFLYLDKPNYFGTFSLSVQDKFDITAMGLLTTKLPDGSDLFSLVLALMAEFSPAIQLSFGFALSGVGGLIGIHRTMNEEALIDAQKAHTLETLLFPEDPIRNANLILTNIQNIFPVKEGRFVFGPMVKIFWGGAIPLVEFSVGIFLEVGGPIRIAIIGRAHAALPKPNTPIITLNLDVLGFIDFGNKTLAIDASLYDSNILNKFDLVGDMALRSNWGDNPDFALSLGGFHPRFAPPPGFPDLKRLGIKFGKNNPRLSLTMYLAITTNSFQTGAMVDFFAKSGPFKATAGFGFDTLIYFKPFKFIADIYAWANVSGKNISIGADLNFSLSGPNPYRAKGYAAVHILAFDVPIKFDKTFGNSMLEVPILSEPAQVLYEQLMNIKPIFEIPDWAHGGVILTEDAEDFLSPIGELNISQNAVPLDFSMDLFAEGVPPSNERKLSLLISNKTTPSELVRLNTDDPPEAHFAPAQFKNMSDTEKISAPPFEKYKSGERIIGEGKISTNNCVKTVKFETILRNPDVEDVVCGQFSLEPLSAARALFTKKIWAMQGAKKYFKSMKKSKDKTSSQHIQVKEKEYTITKHNANNGVFERTYEDEDEDGVKVPNMTYHEAMDIAKKQGRKNVVIRDSAFAEII